MDAATLILSLAGLVLLVAVVNAVKSAERTAWPVGEAGDNHAPHEDDDIAMPIAPLSAGPVPSRRRIGREDAPGPVFQARHPEVRQSAAAPAGLRVTTVQFTEIIVFRRRR